MMVTYSSYTDEQLVEALAGDAVAAFDTLYSRYQPLLFTYAYRLTGDTMQAQDIVQEIFVALWDGRGRLSITHSVSAYFYGSVRNQFYKLAAADRLRQDLSGKLLDHINTVTPATDSEYLQRELQAVVEQLARQLPGNMGEIFILSRIENLSNPEIAEQLGLSEKTVRNQLSLGSRKIRDKLTAIRKKSPILVASPVIQLLIDRFL